VFNGAVRAAVEVALVGRRRCREFVVAAVHRRADAPPVTSGCCADDEHRWDRLCTTVMAGKPLVVEYRCRRCGAWTVQERHTW
jgi:hypothetical protein